MTPEASEALKDCFASNEWSLKGFKEGNSEDDDGAVFITNSIICLHRSDCKNSQLLCKQQAMDNKGYERNLEQEKGDAYEG